MRVLVSACLVMGVLLTSACRAGRPEPVGGSPTAPDAGAVVGVFTAALGPQGPELTGPNLTGRWTLEITASDEAFLTTPTGDRFPAGNPVTRRGDSIVFAPDPECPTQRTTPMAGEYRWAVRGDSLRLTQVQDSCANRAFVLTSQRWQRSADHGGPPS